MIASPSSGPAAPDSMHPILQRIRPSVNPPALPPLPFGPALPPPRTPSAPHSLRPPPRRVS
jgi:hypothetical protein